MHPGASIRAGMILPVTLAALLLASGLALWLQARALGLARVAQAAALQEELRLAAAEGARAAMAVLAADEDLTVDHLLEDWAQPMEWNLPNGIHLRAQIEDAGRFFAWNNLALTNTPGRPQAEILLDVLTFCGDFAPITRVEALQDYVDADGDGAYETAFYRHADPPLLPPNRPLWAPAELLHIHDFTPELFQLHLRSSLELFNGNLQRAVAVIPVKPKAGIIPININTAGREVLMGVSGLQHEASVRMLLSLREVQPFTSLAPLFAANPEWAAQLEGVIATSSSIFRIRAEASKSGFGGHGVLAWVKRSSKGDIEILQWMWEQN